MTQMHGRSAWTPTPNERAYRPIANRLEGVTLHWPASGASLQTYTRGQVAAYLESIRRDHVQRNKWIDIGYNHAVDGNGELWNLTGLTQGAHAGTNYGNQRTAGLVMLYGTGERPNAKMIEGVRSYRAWVLTQNGSAAKLFGHRDHQSNQCPGQPAYDMIHNGTFNIDGAAPPAAGGGSATTAPAFPLPVGWYFGPKSGPKSSISGYYSYRHDLKRWQQRMKDRGWNIMVDGLYGPNTERVARQFQAEKGLSRDGLIGIDTWVAAWAAPVT